MAELKENKTFIQRHTSLTTDQHIKNLNVDNYERVNWAKVPIPNLHLELHNRIKVVLFNYVNAKAELSKVSTAIKKAKSVLLEYKIVADILESFNDAMVDEMIKTGYTFMMPFALGDIFVKKNLVKNPKVDWEASNKKKKAIIERGGVPYKQDVRPDGEKWLIYFDNDYETYYRWRKSNNYVTNKMFFCFTPTQSALRLFTYVNNNPTVLHRYKTINFPGYGS